MHGGTVPIREAFEPTETPKRTGNVEDAHQFDGPVEYWRAGKQHPHGNAVMYKSLGLRVPASGEIPHGLGALCVRGLEIVGLIADDALEATSDQPLHVLGKDVVVDHGHLCIRIVARYLVPLPADGKAHGFLVANARDPEIWKPHACFLEPVDLHNGGTYHEQRPLVCYVHGGQ